MKYFLKYFRKPNSEELGDFKQYALLMLMALTPCILVYGIFYMMFSKGIHLNSLESNLVKLFTFSILGYIYAGRANKAIDKADAGFDEMLEATREVSQEKFNKAYHKRITRWNHLFLATISSFIILILMLIDYESFFTGAIIILPITYVMSLLMLFAVSLDHAGEIPLFKRKIPSIFFEKYEEYVKEKAAKLKELEKDKKTPD